MSILTFIGCSSKNLAVLIVFRGGYVQMAYVVKKGIFTGDRIRPNGTLADKG